MPDEPTLPAPEPQTLDHTPDADATRPVGVEQPERGVGYVLPGLFLLQLAKPHAPDSKIRVALSLDLLYI